MGLFHLLVGEGALGIAIAQPEGLAAGVFRIVASRAEAWVLLGTTRARSRSAAGTVG
jgi:hypothetical protein